jgi:hypothetical protein
MATKSQYPNESDKLTEVIRQLSRALEQRQKMLADAEMSVRTSTHDNDPPRVP